MRKIPESQSLKQGLEKASRKGSSAPSQKHPTLDPDLMEVDIPLEGSKQQQGRLAYLVNEVCKSPAGRFIIDVAASSGYELCFDKDCRAEGIYGYAEPVDQICALNPDNTPEESIITLAHELRHAFQFNHKITENVDARSHTTKSKMMLDRVMEADAESYGCLVAWELKEKGLSKSWNDFSEEFPEVAGPFEKALKDGRPLSEARMEAFLGWYDNAERRDSYDESHLAALQDIEPKVLKKKLSSMPASKIVKALCHDIENGTDYFTKDPAMLETGKYVAVSEERHAEFKAYFAERDKLPERQPDKSLDQLVVEPSLPEQEKPKAKKKPKAVSQEARKVSLETKQAKAASVIKEKRAKNTAAPATLSSAIAATKKFSRY